MRKSKITNNDLSCWQVLAGNTNGELIDTSERLIILAIDGVPVDT